MADMGVDVDFLTDEQVAAFGRFTGPPTVAELDQFFVLDEEDFRLVGKRRRDSSRLGFAVQFTTLRFIGAFLDDPIDVPAVVVDELAAQLGIADPSCIKAYTDRDNTRWDHRREICRETGWIDYAESAFLCSCGNIRSCAPSWTKRAINP